MFQDFIQISLRSSSPDSQDPQLNASQDEFTQPAPTTRRDPSNHMCTLPLCNANGVLLPKPGTFLSRPLLLECNAGRNLPPHLRHICCHAYGFWHCHRLIAPLLTRLHLVQYHQLHCSDSNLQNLGRECVAYQCAVHTVHTAGYTARHDTLEGDGTHVPSSCCSCLQQDDFWTQDILMLILVHLEY